MSVLYKESYVTNVNMYVYIQNVIIVVVVIGVCICIFNICYLRNGERQND